MYYGTAGQAVYPGAYGAPFAGLYETSGYGDGGGYDGDEMADEMAAEGISDQIVAQTGALPLSGGIDYRTHVASALRLPVTHPKVQAVAQKVAAKVPAKKAGRPPITYHPRPVAPAPAAAPRKRITSISELMERVTWCELASLNNGAAQTLAIGATNIASTINVSRTGWVLDWGTNNNNGDVLASSLTYGQLPNTIFGANPLSKWGPAAANPSPIDPVYVTMPATFNVLLTNTNPAAQVITWQMSGIPNEAMHRALLDPDVVEYLAGRGLEIARQTQAGLGFVGF